MGIIKGTAITILSIILLISLFLMSLSLTLNWSLDYETIKPSLKNSIKSTLINEFNLTEYVDQEITAMMLNCQNSSEFVFNQEGYTFVVPCEKVNQGPESVLDYSLDNLIKTAYYKDYECSFLQCVKETDTMLVLVSKEAKDFWNSKFYIFLLISLALATLIFLMSNNKATAFLITGPLMIISSLPLLKINWFLSTPIIPDILSNVLTSFFTKSTNVFWTISILGFLLFLLGISLHFFDWGKKITNWFSKNKDNISKDDVKEIIKEESKKSKN